MGKDQNNFYLLLYGEKIRTQDFVDENGRKDAQHCKERAGACLGYRKDWSEHNWKNETQWRTRTAAVRATTVSLLCLSLFCSHVVSGTNQRKHGDLRIKVFNNILLNSILLSSATVTSLPPKLPLESFDSSKSSVTVFYTAISKSGTTCMQGYWATEMLPRPQKLTLHFI